jgi:hypothetical protein
VEKSDQFHLDKRTGKQIMKQTTDGWELEVEWRESSTSWLPLKELKEINIVDVAQYAVDNQIEYEPAFEWCVRGLFKKKNRLIKTMKKHHVRRGFKFGIQIPTTWEEAIDLDKENGNNFWLEATMKELSNVCIAFDIQGRDKTPPVGYRRIPCHLIFDIKMDFS